MMRAVPLLFVCGMLIVMQGRGLQAMFMPPSDSSAGLLKVASDPWGREYPAQCSPEALAGVKIPIVRVPQSFLDKATKSENRYGVFLPTGAMAVLDSLEGDMLQGVIDHEACHWLMRELTGKPEWHK